MGRHSSKNIKVLVIIFAGWFIGVPIYCGYCLLNDADFLATLPQVENPDLDGLSFILKNQLSLIIPAQKPIFFPIGRLAFFPFPQAVSLERINSILRC